MWNTSTIALYTSLSSSVAKMPWVIIPKNSMVRTTDISWLVQSQCVLCFVYSHDVSHTGYVLWIYRVRKSSKLVRLKSESFVLRIKFKKKLNEEKQRTNNISFRYIRSFSINIKYSFKWNYFSFCFTSWIPLNFIS